jgi:hypothetical protein
MAHRLANSALRLLMHRHAPMALFALFVLPRAAMIACAVTPTSDADWYYGHAAMLAQGKGYLDGQGHPTAFWPVGWPFLLSLAFRLGGVSVVTVGVVNLLAAIATAWLTLDLGRRLTGSEAAARIGLLAFAVYPNAVLYVPLALTEVMYTALLLGAIRLMVVPARTPVRGWVALVLAGLVFGLATLVKAQTLVIVPAILAIALWREPGVWHRLPRVAAQGMVVLVAAALVIAPWTLRNHRELRAWVPISTNGGFTLLTGNNDSANGGYTPDDPLVRALDARHDLDEVARDVEARRLGTAWIRSHPARFARLAPLKLWRLWGPDGEGQWAYETGSWAFRAAPFAFLALRAVNQLWYWMLLAAFAAAPWAIVRARRAAGQHAIDWWLIAYAVAAFPSVIAVIFSGQSRFHYPAMPFVCIIAGWLIARLLAARTRNTA